MKPTYDPSNPLSTLLDFYLENGKDTVYAILAHPQEEETVKVSYREFARAGHRFAKWIQGHVPPGETVTFLPQTSTLMEFTTVVGCVRGGHTVFPISPRLAADAVCVMLKNVSSHTMLVARLATNPLVAAVRALLAEEQYEVNFIEFPILEDIYPELGEDPDQAKFEKLPLPDPTLYAGGVAAYLHTSGSAGFPKSVGWTHKLIHGWSYGCSVRELREMRAVLSAQVLPIFHATGLFSCIFNALYSGHSVAIFAPSYTGFPTPDAVLRTSQISKANVVWVPPVFLELWVNSDEAIEFLLKAEQVGYGGGPLAEEVGNKLAARGVKLGPLYGGTEMGSVLHVKVLDDAWEYCRMSDIVCPRWADQGDGTYELQLLTCESYTPAIENLPDTRGFATGDLFVPHPTLPDRWKVTGRRDDVIVLGNGEKVMAIPMETRLRAHPMVSAALLFGRGAEQVGFLIEPSEPIGVYDAEARSKFIEEIWPVVQVINEKAPDYARVMKEMILVTSPSKPMLKAAKGTVQRGLTLREYQNEIRVLYTTGGYTVTFPTSEDWSSDGLAGWLERLVKSVQEEGQRNVEVDDDFFSAGLDSLAASALRTRIISGLRRSPIAVAREAADSIPRDFIYAYPSLKRLQGAVEARLRPQANGVHKLGIDDMVQKYAHLWPSSTLVITGTTGNLGCHLLSACLNDERVRRIYALNRPSTRATAEGHAKLFKERSLSTDVLFSSKVVFLQSEAHQEQLGLNDEMYSKLCASVTHIFHLAWRLDFNLKLASFENSIRFTRQLLDLGLACRARARFIFASSVAVASSWPAANGPYPEEPVSDSKTVAGASGYGQSKFVSEQLLLDAAERGLETCALRIGQVTGARASGVWAPTDWVPIFVKTSLALGCLPSTSGDASWIPMDVTAHATASIAFATAPLRRAHNIVHPRPISWAQAFGLIADALAARGVTTDTLPLVPLGDWHTRLLDRLAAAPADPNLPASKLLAFIEGLLAGEATDGLGNIRFATAAAEAVAPALAGAETLGAPDAEAWVDYWCRAGFLGKSV